MPIFAALLLFVDLKTPGIHTTPRTLKIMQHISESSLEHLPSRIEYLRSFIDFTSEDAAALHAAKPVVGPLVPAVVEMVYEKLFTFDITAKSFVPRQTGYEGTAPAVLSDLKQDHPQIKFRKDFLKAYLVKLVTLDYEKIESWEYLDRVGIMHTGRAGFSHRYAIFFKLCFLHSAVNTTIASFFRISKPSLRVEYIHCAILLGYVEDILLNAIITHPDLDSDTKNAVARAVNKVRFQCGVKSTTVIQFSLQIVWIQNDLFARHYIDQASSTSSTVDTITLKRPIALSIALGLFTLGALAVNFYTKF